MQASTEYTTVTQRILGSYPKSVKGNGAFRFVSAGARIPIVPVENSPPPAKWCMPALTPSGRRRGMENQTVRVWKTGWRGLFWTAVSESDMMLQ
jgi:hypothetical protein